MTPSIEKAEEASRKLGFANEDTVTALAKLETATGDTHQAIRDLALAEDAARLKGTDLDSATKIITGTLAGNTRAARQLGLVVPSVTSHYDALKKKYQELGQAIPPAEAASARLLDKQATGAATLQLVTDKVHGQAQAFSETAAGGMAQFHAQLGNLEEQIGTALLPALTMLVGKLTDLMTWLTGSSDSATRFKQIVSDLGTVAVPLLTVSFMALKTILTPIYEAVKALDDLFHGRFTATLDDVKTALLAVLDPLHVFPGALHAVEAAAGSVAGFFKNTFDGVLAATRSGINLLKSAASAVGGALDAVRSAAGTVAGYLAGGFIAAINAAKGPVHELGGVFDTVKNAISAIHTAASSTFGALAGVVKAALRGLSSAVNSIVGAFSPLLSVLHQIESAANSAKGAIDALKGAAGAVGGALGAVGGLFHRAAGGPVSVGQTYVVGERGPELFVPAASGYILPNYATPGAVNAPSSGSVSGDLVIQVDGQTLGRIALTQLLRLQGRNVATGLT